MEVSQRVVFETQRLRATEENPGSVKSGIKLAVGAERKER
jgi:hypothetical protein